MRSDAHTNTFEFIREIEDQEVRVTAAYNKSTDDWIIVCFRNGKLFATLADKDVWSQARGLIELALRERGEN